MRFRRSFRSRGRGGRSRSRGFGRRRSRRSFPRRRGGGSGRRMAIGFRM